jgi:hypothetical protein
MSNVLWAVFAVVICGGLLYLAYAIEPHWVAKDGSRFLTTSETIDRFGKTVSKRHEVRGTIMSDGVVLLGKRNMMRTRSTLYRVRGKSPTVERNRALYLLESIPPDPDGEVLVLRIPMGSSLIEAFDALVPPTGDPRT